MSMTTFKHVNIDDQYFLVHVVLTKIIVKLVGFIHFKQFAFTCNFDNSFFFFCKSLKFVINLGQNLTHSIVAVL